MAVLKCIVIESTEMTQVAMITAGISSTDLSSVICSSFFSLTCVSVVKGLNCICR